MTDEQTMAEVVSTLSLRELCRFCHAEERWVVDLVSYGVLDPEGRSPNEWRFQGANIPRAKKAKRLQRDLGINIAGIAMVLDLLEERDALLRRISLTERS